MSLRVALMIVVVLFSQGCGMTQAPTAAQSGDGRTWATSRPSVTGGILWNTPFTPPANASTVGGSRFSTGLFDNGGGGISFINFGWGGGSSRPDCGPCPQPAPARTPAPATSRTPAPSRPTHREPGRNAPTAEAAKTGASPSVADSGASPLPEAF